MAYADGGSDFTDEPIDVSIYNFPKEIWFIIPQWELTVKITTFIPVILLGVLGNMIILNIIIKNRALRTPTNLLIANMAAADMATVLVCPIMFMYHDFYQSYRLGPIGCKAEGFLEGTILITAVLNLCAVSYDRLTAIVMPLETRLTIRGAKICMFCTWIIGFLLSSPLAIYRTYKERQWKNFLETYCSENTVILPMYWHVLIAALVWFPLTIMVICYSAIFYKLDRYEQHILKREHPISISYKTKVAKMLFIVVMTFVILRVPFTALVFVRNEMLKNIIANQAQGSFQILWYTSHYLIFLNAAVNPVIYGMTNDNFRRAYHQTPLFSCFFKPKIKPRTNAKYVRNCRQMLPGKLQPRGPCREDKFAGIKTIIFPFDKAILAGFSSKTTKSTQIRPLPTRSDETGKECNPQPVVVHEKPNVYNLMSTNYI